MNPQVPGPKDAPSPAPPAPPAPPNVPASTPKTGWSPTLTWGCIGWIAITVVICIADGMGRQFDETLVAAVAALVTVLGGYFGQGRGRK